MLEVWKDIKDYEGYYQISNIGNVKSLERIVAKKNSSNLTVNEKILKPAFNFKKYLRVILSKKNNAKLYAVHRLVALAFISNPLNKATVNHKNGIKTDNRVENLEWMTNKENLQHAHRTGLIGNMAKHKDNILKDYLTSGLNIKMLSEKYGISKPTIRKFLKEKNVYVFKKNTIKKENNI